MGRRRWPAHGGRTATASFAVCFLLSPGCAVTAPDDCTEKATCAPPDSAGVVLDATSGETSEASGDDSPGPVGDDGPAATGDAADATAPDVDLDSAADTTLQDVTVEGAVELSPEAGDAAPDGSPSVPEAGTPEASTGCDPTHPDCSNPACTPGFSCVPSVPSGWSGPAVLYDLTSAGAPAPQAGACPATPAYGVMAYDGHASPDPQGTCSCTCGAVTGSCTGPTVTIYHGTTCVSQCQNVDGVTSACARGCASADALSAAVTSAAAFSGGSCSASLTNTLVPFATATDWTTTGRVCGASRGVDQGGCSATQICADAPPAATTQAWCIYQAGSTTCPAGYPAQHVYFAAATDTRACAGTCTCGAATGAVCSTDSVSVSATTDCASAATFASTAVGQCNENLGATARNVTASVSVSGGQCPPSGNPSVSGTVTAATPTTVCCT